MAKTLEVRGRFDAHYAAYAYKGYYGSQDGSTDYPTEDGTDNTWESARITFNGASGERFVGWPGRENWSTTQNVTFYFNIITRWATGNPGTNQALVDVRTGNSTLAGRASGALIYINTSGQLVMQIFTGTGSLATNLIVSGWTWTQNTATQIQCSYNGATGAYNFIQDGSVIASGTNGSLSNRDHNNISEISIGAISGTIIPSLYDLYLFEVYDSIESDLTQRSDFDATTTNQPENWSSLTAAQIESGVNQIQAGVTVTGTFIGDWTSLAASDIRSGVDQVQAGLTQTGSFTGEIWSTILASQIQDGVNQIQNSVTITGTLAVPTPNSGPAGTVDLNAILETVQYALQQANTTSGDPLDLSESLASRVKRVHKYKPDPVGPHRTELPAIHCWIEKKDMEQIDVSINQATGKREGTIDIKVAGILHNDSFTTKDENEAEEQSRYLMENIERVLRSYDTLDGNVDRQLPQNTIYFDVPYDGDVNYKAGVLSIQAKVKY